MKGYRTPSWFRMKGFLKKTQAKTGKKKTRSLKIKDTAPR